MLVGIADFGRHLSRRAARSFDHPAAPFVVAACYVAFGLWSLAGDRHLHDEGILTWIFSDWLHSDPVATAFFQKCKPVTAAFYALPSLAGLGAFLVAHVLVSAAAIPMIAAVARASGMRASVVPAVVIGASPMFLQAGAAGLSNADAVAVTALFLFLSVALRRPLAAGLVLGAMPWVRYELAPLVLVLWVYEWLGERRGPLLFGALAFPVAYLGAGAVYHADVLWMVHYPPALPEPMPGNPVYEGELSRYGAVFLVQTWLAVTPAILIAPLARWRALSGLDRALVVFAIVYVVVMNLMPQWQIFNFGVTPRYSLLLLVPVAVLSARVADAWWRGTLGSMAALPVLLLALAAGVYVHWHTRATGVLWLVAACAATVALARGGRSRTAVVAVVSVAVVGATLFDDEVRLARSSQSPGAEVAARWLEENDEQGARRLVYTDIAILDALLRRSDSVRNVEVRYLIQADQLHELVHLSNPHNGQRERLRALLDTTFYGEPVAPETLQPADIPSGALFVLSSDERLQLVLPSAKWDRYLDEVRRTERVIIARFNGDG